jgi:hypothetical protein
MITADQFIEIYVGWVRSKGRLYNPCKENSFLMAARLEDRFLKGEDLTSADFEVAFKTAEAEGTLVPVEISLADAQARIQKEKDRVDAINREREKRDRGDSYTDSEGAGKVRHKSEQEIERERQELEKEGRAKYIEQVQKIWLIEVAKAKTEDEFNDVLSKIRQQCENGDKQAFGEAWIAKNAPSFNLIRSADALDATNALTAILEPVKVSTATVETKREIAKWVRTTSAEHVKAVRKANPLLAQKMDQILIKSFEADL